VKPVKEVRVRDFMVTKPVVFTRETDVVDERGNLVGVLTERDFLKAALVAGYHGERGGCIGDYMTRDVEAVNADDSLLQVPEVSRHGGQPGRRRGGAA